MWHDFRSLALVMVIEEFCLSSVSPGGMRRMMKASLEMDDRFAQGGRSRQHAHRRDHALSGQLALRSEQNQNDGTKALVAA